jgi:hypothetical protein
MDAKGVGLSVVIVESVGVEPVDCSGVRAYWDQIPTNGVSEED